MKKKMVNFTALQILFDEDTGEFRVLPQQNVQIDVPEDTKNQTPGFAYEGAACRLNVLRTMRNLRLQQLVNEGTSETTIMGKPIQQKPPYFKECPICHREFGSKSLEIHKSRCLERQKSSSDQDSDSVKLSPKKKATNKKSHKNDQQQQQKHHHQPSIISKAKKNASDADDDEVETSLSDELNNSWPSSSKTPSKMKKANSIRTGLGIRRKRERKKDRSEGTSSGEDDTTRPKTATLKRPHILDESLKDKVDMTLTKKEFLAAVKLCSDVAVQRGLPNMRLKATKNGTSSPSKKGFQPPKQDPILESSPYMSKILGKIMGKRKGEKSPPDVPKAKEGERPKTTKLDRPSDLTLDLPHIHVKPQHVISNRLSRHLKLKNRVKKTLHDTQKLEPSIGQIHLLGKQKSSPKATKVEVPKEKVPEPCRSCGRSDFPERLHTHLHHHHHHHNHDNNNSTKSNISPSKNNKKKTSTTSQWLSPARNRPRSKSLDDTNADPSNTSTSITDSNSEDDKSDAKTNDKDNSSLKIVDITDEVTQSSDIEMDNVVVDEVNAKKLNKDTRMSPDGSSDSDSKLPAKIIEIKHSKRPPPPSTHHHFHKILSSKSENSCLNEATGSGSSNNELENENNNILGLVPCAVCGRQIGKNSIKFHLKQCQKKQQLIKDRQDAEDKKVAQSIEEETEGPAPYIHEAIWEAHVQQLIPCSRCGRTFFPDRIKVHQKSCKGLTVKVANNQSSPIQESKASSTNNNPTATLPLSSSSTNNSKKSSQLDLLYMNSPSLMRRTLHNQDDTIIANHANSTFEDTTTASTSRLSKKQQVQTTNKKDNTNNNNNNASSD